MKKVNRGISARKVAVIGAGVAAAGAGAYYLLGPKGKQHRAQAKVWMGHMKSEVEKELIKAKSTTKTLYHDAVDALAAMYRKQYAAHGDAINTFARKLKSEWQRA